MKNKYLLFDFDGTLFDTMWLWNTIGDKYLQSKDVIVPTINQELQSMSWEEGCVHLGTYVSSTISQTQVLQEISQLLLTYVDCIKPKKGVLSFLHERYQEGCLLYILSTGNDTFIKAVLKKYQIDTLFCNIYTCDMLGVPQKTPEIYYLLMELWSIEAANILVFEDDYQAASSASEAGCYVIGVKEQKQDQRIYNVVDEYIMDFIERERKG